MTPTTFESSTVMAQPAEAVSKRALPAEEAGWDADVVMLMLRPMAPHQRSEQYWRLKP